MMELMTRTDGIKYLLTKKERDILQVICEAEKPLTVVEICERAGCTRRTYQYFMTKKNFKSLLAPALNYMVESNLIPIFGSLLSKAKQGSVKHQELLFKVLRLIGDNRPDIVQIFNFSQDGSEDSFLTNFDVDRLIGR